MEDGARTLREQRAAYVGMQEWTSEDVKRGGTAGFLKSVPAIIMIAGSFFKPKGKELFYVLLFIELALSAEEDFQQPVDRCQQYNTGADSEIISDDTNRSETISQDI